MSGSARRRRAGSAHPLLLVPLGLLFAFVIMELVLRVYNPFQFRLKGDKIDLWPGRQHVIEVPNARRLDSVVVGKRNSLGFRGEEPTADFAERLTIIAVGGSTTEGNLLSEGKTWPDLLAKELRPSVPGVWVNNAGLSGQSTFGHQVLMRDYVISVQPKVVLFLIGINDVGLGAPKLADVGMTVQTLDFRSAQQFYKSLARHSEVLGLTFNLYRYSMAKRRQLADEGEVDFTKVDTVAAPMPEAEKARIMEDHRTRHLPAYEERVLNLVRMSRENGIEPVLITQPMLFGYVVDDVTGVNLAKLDWDYQSGPRWEFMEMYNDVVREVGRREGVLVIELGRSMPKSTRYFYDNAHYTNEGAAKVAEIVHRDLCPFLAAKYPRAATTGCGVQ